ncbi:MAG: hypothetical protein FWB91_11920 [Defluviitaleaceae bacterium]|nr:hypothetical protein [Defluviitaleaceae bacterium]
MLHGPKPIGRPNHEMYDESRPGRECGEKHKHRVAKATLELAIDVSTDFNCEND